jgi:hypothetical protein
MPLVCRHIARCAGNTNTEITQKKGNRMKYTCFKKCGVEGVTLGDLYAHYKAEPTHHRLYGHDEYRERQSKRKSASGDKEALRKKWREQAATWRAKQKAAKTNGHTVGREVGFHKHLSVVGAKGRKSTMAILQAQLQAAINEAAQKLEKLQFAQQLLEKGRLEA